MTATEGATVSGIAANTVIAAGQPSNPYNSSPSWGAVAVAALPFNLNLPTNLAPGRHDIVVTLNQGKKINRAVRMSDNYNYWQCVKNSPSVYPAGIAPSDFTPCLTGPAQLVVTINVPQTNYSGTISTTKRLASDSSILATGSTPGNALIELKSPDTAQPIFDSNSTSNPWNRSNVYVLWNDKFSNTPGRYYKNTITVPRDWRVNRVQTSLPSNGVLTNDGLSCTEANQSGVCTVSGLTVYNGSVTYVDWFLEKIPVPIPYYPWLQTKTVMSLAAIP